MVNYENDYLWGEKQQKRIFPILEKKWEGIVAQGRYAKYDAVSETVNIEIKSRKNRYNAYPTTMLTMNKISDLSKTNIFVFNFVAEPTVPHLPRDHSIYYIEYDPDRFSKYTKTMFSRAEIESDEKEYVFIPIEDLTLLHRDTEI